MFYITNHAFTQIKMASGVQPVPEVRFTNRFYNYNHVFIQIGASSTTQKHTKFVREPMGDKAVIKVPGIGGALGEQLSYNGCNKAYKLFGHFLILEKDETKFKQWLLTNTDNNINALQQNQCYESLRDWSIAYI